MLSGTAPARLPRRPVTLFAESAELGDKVQLEVDSTLHVVRPKAGMLIIPVIDGPITVSAVPMGTDTFPVPAVIHITAVTSAPGVEDERVVLPAVSVAGLAMLDLMLIEPDGPDLSCSRPTVTEQVRLSPLGDAALASARRALGTARLPTESRYDVEVIVDDSVSMATEFRSGRLAGAIELLTGIAPLIGLQQEISPVLAGRPEAAVVAEPPRLAQAVVDQLSQSPLRTGCRFTPEQRSTSRKIRYVVTDSLLASDDLQGHEVHHLVLADRSAQEALTLSSRHPVTVLGDSASRLLADQRLLNEAVGSLLAPIASMRARGAQ